MRILLAEDEKELNRIVCERLREEQYSVDACLNGEEALAFLQVMEYDVVILDIMMPEMNGFTLCQKIRENHTFPVIMLTAKDEETDKITGLTLGADDYITKPFRPLELVARVKAQLRRYKRYNPSLSEEKESDIISHSSLLLNIRTHECHLNEKPVTLTPTEFTILQILLENKGTVMSAEDLFHRIWKDEYYSKRNNTITVHIRHLREKLNDSVDNPKYIKTI